MSTAKIPTAKLPKRLTRSQIASGLEGVSMDRVILGAQSPLSRLTHKQRTFARAIAQGETKAGAYRAAYNTNTHHNAQSLEGQRLVANPAVALQIEAFKVAAAAAAYTYALFLNS